MNSTTVSNFFSRDVFLKRQARTHKRRPSTNTPLPIIIEEDESRPASAAGRYRRRHANLTVSDIRLAKSTFGQDDDDDNFAEHHCASLSTPRPAPLPPVSPSSSPDSFSLDFSHGPLKFPHPPIPTPSSRSGSTSPTPSMSSGTSTSPESPSSILPPTPCTSDDECFSPVKPRRVSVRPLVITKNLSSSNSPSPLRQYKEHSSSPEEDYSDSEESDSEWYHREFSKILTLCSPQKSLSQNSRPESVIVSNKSSALPPTPSSSSFHHGFPSLQLDPAYPRNRRSRVSIPNYPPPPVPTAPEKVPSTPSRASKRRTITLTVTPPPHRPPQPSDIPADCVWVDNTLTFTDDTVSDFSFSLYDTPPSAESSHSCYSQPSFQSPNPSPFPSSFPSTPSSLRTPLEEEEFDFPVDVDDLDFEFDIEQQRSSVIPPLTLPPTSPIDLEADINSRFEQLRNTPLPLSLQPQQPVYPTIVDDVFSVANSTPSATTAPAPALSADHGDEQEQEPQQEQQEQPQLKSRWSTSTLNSIHEEHARRSGGASSLSLVASAKLRAYFGSSSSSSKSHFGRRSGFVAAPTPTTPLTPMSPMSPTKRFYTKSARRESDMIHGYGMMSPLPPPSPLTRSATDGHQHHHGLRRRGSLSPSVSDAGSDESSSSTSSSGLRRKPIPVEMFLRSAA